MYGLEKISTTALNNFFSNKQLENEKLALKDFIAKTGGQCIQVLKDDYFNKMTP
ncbi:hypothetical protein [Caldifermentibacillus hisashii]|uniref:hypothetical protein n=1 Tax=Caldifermentibacillus hisashii TaxID=996558 RepID=UPI00159637C4|nr:hypothetical protein [Caldifermentibacillus hisashii]